MDVEAEVEAEADDADERTAAPAAGGWVELSEVAVSAGADDAEDGADEVVLGTADDCCTSTALMTTTNAENSRSEQSRTSHRLNVTQPWWEQQGSGTIGETT